MTGLFFNMTKRYFILIACLLLLIAVVSVTILSFEFTEESVRVLIRWSAKISVSLFSLSFMSSALNALIKTDMTKLILRWRPQMGLSFTVFHTAHLFFLLLLQSCFHPVFTLAKTSSLIGGGMAYVLMYLMAVTTFPSFKKRLTVRQWSILHTIGSYWIWLIFFRSYLKNVLFRGEEYVLFVLISMAMLFRILKILKNRLS